jgi:hypothetical protein
VKVAAWAFLSALAAGAPSDAGDAWEILADIRPDEARRVGEVPLHPAPGGLALTLSGGGWHLVPASLEATTKDVDAEGQPQTVTLAATPANARVYLRLQGLRPGKVDTPDVRFDGAPRDLEAATLSLPFKGRPWRFETRGNAIWFTDGRRRQKIDELAALDNPAYPVGLGLAWAGDLDRDGRLDFVTILVGGDGSTTCVWLSSKAAAGELVAKTACVDRLV